MLTIAAWHMHAWTWSALLTGCMLLTTGPTCKEPILGGCRTSMKDDAIVVRYGQRY
jgi:hypothetical protein